MYLFYACVCRSIGKITVDIGSDLKITFDQCQPLYLFAAFAHVAIGLGSITYVSLSLHTTLVFLSFSLPLFPICPPHDPTHTVLTSLYLSLVRYSLLISIHNSHTHTHTHTHTQHDRSPNITRWLWWCINCK